VRWPRGPAAWAAHRPAAQRHDSASRSLWATVAAELDPDSFRPKIAQGIEVANLQPLDARDRILFNPDRWRGFVAKLPETAATAFVVTDSQATFAGVAAGSGMTEQSQTGTGRMSGVARQPNVC